ncbi:gamma-glutamyl kinase [Jannaschia ovalis]|uniref:Gamma-glutamyl kinase n=1 Tax=Jannaschia ovalis TaxID=3038773 RepID=A0ABY8LF64_9RHOB|nr:gamma-glutamyl kinase [Jannaschia sp. GRR-S6-38]WGH78823.1 gamma-glutamyl kinase [Jannaschia sp. GRR-S6-38]
MLVFWKARVVLLAVPKTGTTALEAALAPRADAAIVNPPGLKHCTVRKYRRELAEFFEQKGRRPMELIAVMREPRDWLGSWYRYRSRPQLDGQPNSTTGMDFDAFVAAHLSDPAPDFARVGSQAQFLQGGVDHLFRHDRMPDLVGFLQDRIGEEIALPRANVSPAGRTDLLPETEARLRRERAADFNLWNSLQG